jgi:ribosomal protein S18 acetylase RimI-like enzyme
VETGFSNRISITKEALFLTGHDSGFGGVDLQATEQIKYLYILPEHQRGGAGTEVLRELEKAVWAAGIEEVRLHSSPRAVGFYVRQGYKEVEAADQVGHNHEGVEMIKIRG